MPESGLKISAKPWRWIPSLYLAEGIPNAVVVTVAIVLFKNLGIDNGLIAILSSLLYLPWVIKPFWAPFVDMAGTKRRWVLVMQLVMAFSLGFVAPALGLDSPIGLLITLLAVTALASATHDIAADGFYMLALNSAEQSFYVGIRSTFYRAANMIASGGIVWCAGRLIARGSNVESAWSMMFVALGAFFVLVCLWHCLVLPRPMIDTPREVKVADVLTDFAKTVVTFFRKPQIGVALAFILLYRLPEAMLGKMVQPFLLDPTDDGGLGLSVSQVGLANGTFGVGGIVIGGIVGGMVMARFGLRRCLWPMALMLTVPSAFYCYLAAVQPQLMTLICSGLAFEQFGYGFGFTAYMVYMMQFCSNSEYTTSHYAFCTGLMALGLMLPGMPAGIIQQHLGYPAFFALIMVLCVATFAVTAAVRASLPK